MLPAAVAVIVTGVTAVTELVVMVNGGDTLAPAATVTEAGTAATDGLELDRLTLSPPAGATPSRLTTFAVVDKPPVTVAGDKATEPGTAASTFRFVLASEPVMPVRPAVIVTEVEEETAVVAILNADETLAPAGTVTVEGTAATVGLDDDRLKVKPPEGAGEAMLRTLPVRVTPPNAELPARVKDAPKGFTVSTALPIDPFTVPAIVTGVGTVTNDVEMRKLDETVAPAATETEAGTAATAGLELERVTVAPPGGAGLPSVIVLDGTGNPPKSVVCDSPTESGEPVPTPLRLTVCGDPAALDGIVSTPLSVPAAAGLNVTLIVQLLPCVTAALQLFVCEKLPLALIVPIFRIALPLLVTVRANVPVFSTATGPKLRAALESAAIGACSRIPILFKDGSVTAISMLPSLLKSPKAIAPAPGIEPYCKICENDTASLVVSATMLSSELLAIINSSVPSLLISAAATATGFGERRVPTEDAALKVPLPFPRYTERDCER